MLTPKCPDFESQLDAAVERRGALDLTSPDWVGWAEHVRHCAECSKRWREAVTLQAALAAWTTRLPDADLVDGHFADAVMARWSAESAAPASPVAAPRRSGRASWLRWAVVGLASAVAIVVAFLLPRPQGPQLVDDGPVKSTIEQSRPPNAVTPHERTPDEVAKNAVPAGPGDDELAPAGEDVILTGLLRNAGTASLSLAGDAADVVREAASLVSVARSSPSPMVEATIETPSSDFPTQGLIPWSQKLESAVDFLWDAFPLEDAPPT